MRLTKPKASTVKVSANRIMMSIGFFLVMVFALGNLPPSTRGWLLPLVLVAVFVRAAMKAPPVAIAILLYAAMTTGSWFILIAAPGTILLARRYQRMRQHIDLSPTHIRRTVILAMVALVAALPFLSSAVGAWSENARNRSVPSARPLVGGDQGPGEEGLLQRFARWLGFGDDGEGGAQFGEGEPLRPVPRQPLEPDDPFNWWLLVLGIVIVLFLGLAWWLWRRRKPPVAPVFGPIAAQPLARLEAVGASIGRPRAAHEGAISYGQSLADHTGDRRLAEAGPLVSGQVYESAFADPTRVEANLAGIEASPPPSPAPPSIGERLGRWIDRLPVTPRGLLIGALGVVLAIMVGWLIIPRLGDLDAPGQRFGQSAEQLQVVPLSAEHGLDL